VWGSVLRRRWRGGLGGFIDDDEVDSKVYSKAFNGCQSFSGGEKEVILR
jgi:hypothetical protein